MSRAPESLDGYTLIRELGRGGMGVVYEAHDPRLDRRLALKLVLDREADAEALLRFQRESELLARISHPNVLRIHQVGTSQAGPYFVSELVEGEPLEELSRRSGALDPLEAARLLRDLASGVAALHAAGVVHRDLKPGNVVLRPDGSPVLIDFGLARDPRAQRLTVTGALLGTPHYMSPEQALGVGQVGPPSDVYALGSILYALLSGGPPHQGSPTLQVLDAIVKGEVTWPPDTRDRVPAALIELCARAHSKAPEARPSAAELSQELEAFLADPSGSAPGNKAWLGLLLIVPLLGVALAIAWGLDPAPAPTPARSPSASPRRPAPSVTPQLSVSELIASLRRPTPEAFADARTLLETGQGPRLSELRRRYLGARLLAQPTTSVRDEGLPAFGQARWFDDQRLVVTSDQNPGLWLWPDWQSEERIHHDPPGDEQRRRSPPCVFEGLIYQGGVSQGAPLIDVYRWSNAEAPEQSLTSTGLGVRTLAAAHGPGGKALLAVGIASKAGELEGTILILDLESGQVLKTLHGHRPGIAVISGRDTRAGPPGVAALTFSPDGRYLASGGLAGAVILWDVSTWEVATSRILNAGDVRHLAFHPKRPLLAVTAGLGKRVRILTLPKLDETPHRPAFGLGDPSHVAFSRDGRFLFACSNGTSDVIHAKDLRTGELLAYDLESSDIVRSRRFERQAPRCLELSPDGRRLALYSRGPGFEGILEIWELDVPPK